MYKFGWIDHEAVYPSWNFFDAKYANIVVKASSVAYDYRTQTWVVSGSPFDVSTNKGIIYSMDGITWRLANILNGIQE